MSSIRSSTLQISLAFALIGSASNSLPAADAKPSQPEMTKPPGAADQTDTANQDDMDPEPNTKWNPSPVWDRDADGAYHSVGLKSFEGIEEPVVRYVVADGRAESDSFVNITDQGGGVVRMYLRYRDAWWDGDQSTNRRDRQRAEIKGLGPHQKDGETFEYGTTFRTDPAFRGWGRFCHIFQLKATDGSKGPPLVTLSIMPGTGAGALQFDSGRGGFRVARAFTWSPGEWETVRIRVKTTTHDDGELMLSVNGDEFQGVKGLPIFRPQSTEYRPKWGLYRGIVAGMHDDWVEHKNAVAHKLASALP